MSDHLTNTFNVSTKEFYNDFMIMVENPKSEDVRYYFFVLDTARAEKLFDELGDWLNGNNDE